MAVSSCGRVRGTVTSGAPITASWLSRIVLCVAVAMVAAGILMYDVSFATFQRMWDDLVARPAGSLALRFIMQPTMSVLMAVRDGVNDATTGRSPYFSTMLHERDQRMARLREGVTAIGKILLLAMLLDVIYQYLTWETFYPVEALATALLLALIPYFAVRGPVGRVVTRWRHRAASGRASTDRRP